MNKPRLRASDLRIKINALRVKAGLQPSNRLYGTSTQALQIILNKAERGQF